MKEEKMKRIFLTILILVTLTACTANQNQAPEPTSTDIPPAGLPNPASVYCEENGNKLEIQTAADGSQSGVCIFPDGSTCDEWAYFREECGPEGQIKPTPLNTVKATIHASGGYLAPGTSEEISDWWGVIKSTESSAQYGDYFERQDLGQDFIFFGIDAKDPAVVSQIETLRDSGKIVHLYGILLSNVPDFNGSQIQVDRIVVDE